MLYDENIFICKDIYTFIILGNRMYRTIDLIIVSYNFVMTLYNAVASIIPSNKY